jgi:predicted SnoaL-like aldol condensation-catalyzing enzyme
MAAAQDNPVARKHLIERFYEEVYNGFDLDVIAEIVNPAFIDHDQPRLSSRDDIAYIVTTLHEKLPDFQVTIDRLFFQDDLVVVHATYCGTLNDRWAVWTLAEVYRIEDGQIMEAWHSPMAASLSELPSDQPDVKYY